MKTESHPFEPFLPAGARILFLGSFPPQAHRWCMPFYYPNWINDFWRIMGLIFFGDKDHFCILAEKRFDEALIRDFCTRECLAFYDTACEVRRLKDNASDAFLEVVTPTDIAALLARIPSCHTLVTTGQKATEVVADWLGCDVPPIGWYIDVPKASAGPTESDNYFSGRCPKNQFSETTATPTHADVPLRFWRMPSTSRAYPLPLEKKADAYRRLFQTKKLILWDLDGTLIDTLEDLGEAVNHALELRELPLHTVDEYRRMVGHGVRNLVKQALEASLRKMAYPEPAVNHFSGRNPTTGNAELSLADAYIDAALADFKTYYSAHIDVHTRPYPGMQELLADLSAAGIKMAVTSNKFQEGTEHLIREFFPSVDFVAILGNRPGYPLKPSPEIVEEVLSRVGTPADRNADTVDVPAAIGKPDAILVGDSPTDMRTAANGGIEAIAVSWGYRTVEELVGNRIVHSVKELRAALLHM